MISVSFLLGCGTFVQFLSPLSKLDKTKLYLETDFWNTDSLYL